MSKLVVTHCQRFLHRASGPTGLAPLFKSPSMSDVHWINLNPYLCVSSPHPFSANEKPCPPTRNISPPSATIPIPILSGFTLVLGLVAWANEDGHSQDPIIGHSQIVFQRIILVGARTWEVAERGNRLTRSGQTLGIEILWVWDVLVRSGGEEGREGDRRGREEADRGG